MKLTCVTATWNAIKAGNREALIRCVKSVAALKTDHEHLIYDGASTDGTVELLNGLAQSVPGLKIVSEPDTGIYSALNKGVRDAQGEWFYVLGCDDYLKAPQIMDKMISDLDGSTDILATTVRIEKPNGALVTNYEPCMTRLYTNSCACHQGEIMRTEVARALGGFDEQYRLAADSDMFLKAHLQGYRFRYEREIFAVFLDGGASHQQAERSLREHRVSVANQLGLKGKERALMVENSVLTLWRCRQLMKHKDIVVRCASKAMAMTRIKYLFRRWLYPLVVLSRPIRNCRIRRR